MNGLELLPDDFRKEVKVDDDGVGYVSKRGLARLCGVSHQSFGRGGSTFTQKVDEYLASKSFQGGSMVKDKGIPDQVATFVIKYYACKVGDLLVYVPDNNKEVA